MAVDCDAPMEVLPLGKDIDTGVSTCLHKNYKASAMSWRALHPCLHGAAGRGPGHARLAQE
jgi:hypothetical protein